VAAVRRARDEKKYAVAQAALRRYFNALLDHIAVENDELLPMTESIFGPGDLEKIYFRFKDIDNELGADVKRAIESKMMKGQTP
jgi:hemerythrin-like domain-containing protein